MKQTLLILLTAAAAILLAEPRAALPDTLVTLEQGWSQSDREWFYAVDQGSELIDASVIRSIEAPGSEVPFMDPVRLLRYGFVFKTLRPEGLPAGFAVHNGKIGFNCALCHTSNLTVETKTGLQTIRIDGGASLADVMSFLEDVEKALEAAKTGEKHERFLKRMIQAGVRREQAAALLKTSSDEIRSYNARNRPPHPYGFARLDAFGRIYNRVLALADSKSVVPADAPVSFPFLWDAPHHDYVQWVGGVANHGAGSLARNVGQTVGVFGRIDLARLPNPSGYTSSVETGNLIAIEQRLSRLTSPQWPESLLPLDRSLAAKGRRLFEAHCISCHADINRTDVRRRVKAQMYDIDIVRTDPLTAERAAYGKGYSGVLNGRPRHFTPGTQFIGGVEPVNYLLSHVVEGILIRNAARIAQNQLVNAYSFSGPREGRYRKDPANPLVSLLTYKARPLNGIWATAPYLHNGSVLTLYDLLLPGKDRPARFRLGGTRFNARDGGLVSEGPFEFDTALPGNSRMGHEYGTDMKEEERRALLEYLKTL